jgi:hypothetical protein
VFYSRAANADTGLPLPERHALGVLGGVLAVR